MAYLTFQKSLELSWLLRKLENSLLGNASCYRYLPSEKDTSYNLILVIIRNLSIDFVMDCHIHGLEEYQLRSDSCHCRLKQWTDTNASRCIWLAEVFTPPRLNVSNQNSVSTSKSWSSGYHFKDWLQLHIFELNCSYHLCVSCKDINPYLDYL